MRIFVAGASGVIGVRLVPLLVAAGHTVAAMTRSSDKAEGLRLLGAQPVVCDVFDTRALTAVVATFRSEMVVDQLTDLPDDGEKISAFGARNDRIRQEGTRNLLRAAATAGVTRILSQSVAWELPGDGGDAIAEHERLVLQANGVILRYGRLYGPGTYSETEKPPPPRVHVEHAAAKTLAALDAPPGVIVVVVDD